MSKPYCRWEGHVTFQCPPTKGQVLVHVRAAVLPTSSIRRKEKEKKIAGEFAHLTLTSPNLNYLYLHQESKKEDSITEGSAKRRPEEATLLTPSSAA